MSDHSLRTNHSTWLIKAYPFALLLLSCLLNWALGLVTIEISLPSNALFGAALLASSLLVINHSWIMTETELARTRLQIFATPEEWQASGKNRDEVSTHHQFELEEYLNTHRNTTENSLYFFALASLFILANPSVIAAWLWLSLFGLARLGYSASYMYGSDSWRGVFMSLALLSIYGMASYLALCLIFK